METQSTEGIIVSQEVILRHFKYIMINTADSYIKMDLGECMIVQQSIIIYRQIYTSAPWIGFNLKVAFRGYSLKEETERKKCHGWLK